MDRGLSCVIGIYAPEEGKESETDEFYEQRQKRIKQYSINLFEM